MATTSQMNQNLVKGNDVIGKKVTSIQKGKNIEDVDDLVYDPSEGKVKALLVDTGGWFSDAKVILFEDVKSFGKDAIVVESDDVIKKASDVPQRIAHIAKDDTYLTKTKVMTEEGMELGQVTDIYFDPNSGKVSELEVSQGAFKNVASGKKRVQVSDIIKVGEDVTIVKSSALSDVESQAEEKGLRGTYQQAKEGVEKGVKKVKEEGPDLMEKAKMGVKDISGKVSQKAQSLVEKGEDKVREFRESPETQKKMEQVEKKTEKVTGKVKERASQAGKTVSRKAGQVQEAASEKRRKNVLGKYLTVNVLNKEDVLIARRGEVITNELLDDAEDEGVADVVLSNTSEEPVRK
jgi:uncharacterized protein YrrD